LYLCHIILPLCSVRFNKIERGLRKLDGASAAYIRLNNVSAMEARRRGAHRSGGICIALPHLL
jgi:hypothetical protein